MATEKGISLPPILPLKPRVFPAHYVVGQVTETRRTYNMPAHGRSIVIDSDTRTGTKLQAMRGANPNLHILCVTSSTWGENGADFVAHPRNPQLVEWAQRNRSQAFLRLEDPPPYAVFHNRHSTDKSF